MKHCDKCNVNVNSNSLENGPFKWINGPWPWEDINNV